MGSSSIKAIVLTLALLAADPAAAAARADVDAAPVENDRQASPLLPTLGSVGLGIVGLIWVRRHTAEL